MGKKKEREYRVLYNSRAELYKIQEKISFGRWSNLGHMKQGEHVVAYYSNRTKVDQEIEKLHAKVIREFGENWEIV